MKCCPNCGHSLAPKPRKARMTEKYPALPARVAKLAVPLPSGCYTQWDAWHKGIANPTPMATPERIAEQWEVQRQNEAGVA